MARDENLTRPDIDNGVVPVPATPDERDQYAPAHASDLTEQQHTVLALIAEGEGLRAIAAVDGMPSKSTIMRWLGSSPEFRAGYVIAKQLSAEVRADEIIDIADEEGADPNDKRVRIDARKWLAAKQAPKRYGDTSTLRVGGFDADREEMTSEERAVRLAAILQTIDKRRK